MGVTHKLHPEMVEFILSRKQADAALSCRQMVDILWQEKKISISKSAVNNIFKSRRLSSSVGRRSGFIPDASQIEPQETFEIPSVKKQEIFENLRKAAGTDVPFEKPEVVQTPPSVLPVAENKPPAEIIPPQQIESFLPRAAAPDEAPLHPGMGLIILKAAEWSLTSHSIVAEIFQPMLSVPQSADFTACCEAQMFSRFLHPDGELPPEELRQHGAGLLNDYEPSALTSVDLQADPQKSLAALRHYEREEHLLSVRVHGFRVNCSDGKILWFDPQMVSLWDDCSPAAYFALSTNQSLSMISERWLAHNKPLVFFCAPIEQNISAIVQLCEACRGTNRISRISAVNKSMGSLAEFCAPPQQSRIFMMGIWPWQENYKSWLKTEAVEEPTQDFTISFPGRQTTAKDSFYSEISKKDIFCSSHPVVIRHSSGEEDCHLRRILFFDAPQSEAFLGLLTNEMGKNPGELWAEYFRRWPQGDRNLAADLARLKTMNYETGAESLKEVLFAKVQRPDLTDSRSVAAEIQKRFCECLMDYAGQIFLRPGSGALSKQESLREFLKIPGRINRSSETVIVTLKPQKSCGAPEVLKNTVQTINDLDLKDWQSRKLFINIEL